MRLLRSQMKKEKDERIIYLSIYLYIYIYIYIYIYLSIYLYIYIYISHVGARKERHRQESGAQQTIEKVGPWVDEPTHLF